MKQSAATVIPFPQPPRPAPGSADDLARRIIAAKRTIAEAEAVLKDLGPQLVVAMAKENLNAISIVGVGSITKIETRSAMRLDQKAAEALLLRHGIDVPYAPVGGGEQLRLKPAR